MLFFAQEKRFFFLLMSIHLLSKSFTTSVELSLDTEKNIAQPAILKNRRAHIILNNFFNVMINFFNVYDLVWFNRNFESISNFLVSKQSNVYLMPPILF